MRKPDLQNKKLSEAMMKLRDSKQCPGMGIALADLFALGTYLMETNPSPGTGMADESPAGHRYTAGRKAILTVLNALEIHGETHGKILADPRSYCAWLLPHCEYLVLLKDIEVSRNAQGRDAQP